MTQSEPNSRHVAQGLPLFLSDLSQFCSGKVIWFLVIFNNEQLSLIRPTITAQPLTVLMLARLANVISYKDWLIN